MAKIVQPEYFSSCHRFHFIFTKKFILLSKPPYTPHALLWLCFVITSASLVPNTAVSSYVCYCILTLRLSLFLSHCPANCGHHDNGEQRHDGQLYQWTHDNRCDTAEQYSRQHHGGDHARHCRDHKEWRDPHLHLCQPAVWLFFAPGCLAVSAPLRLRAAVTVKLHIVELHAMMFERLRLDLWCRLDYTCYRYMV